jgi:hypothetical protein
MSDVAKKEKVCTPSYEEPKSKCRIFEFYYFIFKGRIRNNKKIETCYDSFLLSLDIINIIRISNFRILFVHSTDYHF